MKEENSDYWKLAEAEHHFNRIEAGIRALASTWMLGAFVAIGQLFISRSEISVIIIVCTMAAVGLTLLWILDQLVYHKLLNSVFLVGLKMEFDNSNLPPIRAMMMASTGGKIGMSVWMRLYYLIPIGGFIIISMAAILLSALTVTQSNYIDSVNLFLLGLFLTVIQVILAVWIVNQSKGVAIQERAALFDDNSFLEVIKGSKYELIIKRYKKDLPKKNLE